MNIFFIRHAPYHFSSGDLTEEGKNMMYKKASYFSINKKYSILTSPVKRAVETAEIIKDITKTKKVNKVQALNTISKNTKEEIAKIIKDHTKNSDADLVLVGHYELGAYVSEFIHKKTNLSRGEIIKVDWQKIKKYV